ncbi:HEPN domain-containing protein [Thalassolituus pacificus]|uniref:HEPN domain-containing protein n=1 Tax=Thalassolituus pacificus TaxID=2975440 RepID=A0A9X2WDW7_9GAMM|nr:HEPN domain-containing protein [Thalassolituus pacificus]MCT7358626.1 HEPN domain-containing protein [Thalassolituus pacificus]
MSKARDNFDIAIQDAERILDAYDKLNRDRIDNRDPEELKRAALIMSLTAWETYVEDRITEVLQNQMRTLDGSQVARFVTETLKRELKYFHTPNTRKTKELFERFLNIDVTAGWNWAGFESKTSTVRLDEWIKKRGDAVHRSVMDKQSGHLVSREDMKKCVTFFKNLVEATDKTLAAE